MGDCSAEHIEFLPESTESSAPSSSCDEDPAREEPEPPYWDVTEGENDDGVTSESVRALARAMQERFDKEVELTNHISQGIAFLHSASVVSEATVVAPSAARQHESNICDGEQIAISADGPNEVELPDTIIAPAVAATPSHAPLYTFEPSPTASPTPPPVLPNGPLFSTRPQEEGDLHFVMPPHVPALRTHHIGGAPPMMRTEGRQDPIIRSPPRQNRSPARSNAALPPRNASGGRATPSARHRSPSPTPNSRPPRALTPTSARRQTPPPARPPASARRQVSPAARSPAPLTARSPTRKNVSETNGPRPVRFTAQPPPGDSSIWTKLYQSGLSTMQLKKRREELEARRREEEEKKQLLQECTFKPALGPVAQSPHIRGNDENVYARLTDSEVKKQIKNKQILKERVDQERNRECTFAPNVAPQQGAKRVVDPQRQKDISERLYRDAKDRDKRRQEQADKAAALEAMRIKAEGLIANHHHLEKEIGRPHACVTSHA